MRVQVEILWRAKIALLLLLCACLSACGGGSSGTGSRSIEGRVLTTSDQPVEGATLTILETGDTTATDPLGSFALSVHFDGQVVTLLISALGVERTVPITLEEGQSATASVEIKIDPLEQNFDIRQVSVEAGIVGPCDAAFENRRTIRQSNRLGDGMQCRVRVSVDGDGRPLSLIPFVMQRGDCREKNWTTIAQGQTGIGAQSGRGELSFTYVDDKANCVYRIIAPYQVKGLQEVVYAVHTFRKQKYDKNHE